MMIVTALGGATHMMPNVTSEPTEVTSVVSKLISLLNYTSSSGSSDLSTLSTVFNWTQVLDSTTDDNYLLLTDTNVLTNDPPISSEFYDTDDNLMNRTTEYFLDDNITSSNQLINVSSPLNISDMEEDLLNSTDDSLNMFSSDSTNYFDMTNDISVSSMKSTTFDIRDMDLDPGSRNISSEQYLDMSGTFVDNLLSTEGVSPSNSVTVANSNFDNGNTRYTSPRESERDQLMSTLITTLATLLDQNRDFSNSNEHIRQVHQILQRVTTDFTDPTKCYSTQCDTVPTDATASTWEPSVTPNDINGKHSPGSITTESTLMPGKPYGKYISNICKVYLAFL
jgi:hypothetical protein